MDSSTDVRQTPRSMFSREHQDAWKKYIRAGRSLAGHDADELKALWSSTEFEDEIRAEWALRKKAASAEAERRRSQAAQAAARPAATMTSALLDRVLEASVKAWSEDAWEDLTALVKEHAHIRIDLADLTALVIAPLGAMNSRNHDRNRRLDALESENAKLKAYVEEELNAREHKGVWSGLKAYRTHNKITYDGSEWTARADNVSCRPGTGPQWELTVKHGRDGKDLR